jgi:hypothetical protein
MVRMKYHFSEDSWMSIRQLFKKVFGILWKHLANKKKILKYIA